MKKRIAILDMWASESTSKGPSKNWLYNELAESFDIDIITLPRSIWAELPLMLRTFSPNRARWGTKFYESKERAGKTPALFRKRTALFQKVLAEKTRCYDLYFQIGALCGPIDTHGVPYVSYHDQTVRMVERGYPAWLPEDFHTYQDEWYRLESALFQAMTRVVTYSEAARRSVTHEYAVHEENVVVIPTGCKLSLPSRKDVLVPRKNQMLFVTTDFYRKGGDLLLSAFPIIKSNVPGIQLIIAGGRLPEDVRITDPAIRHVGSVPMNELQRYYLESRLLVHPARYDAFPNVIKEAIACGLPIVASGVCGIPEMIDCGKTGIILKKTSPETLAEAVCRLFANNAEYRHMQERLLVTREKYQPSAIVARFVNLFEHCLHEHRRRRRN